MCDTVPCVSCGTSFTPRNRDQNFCSRNACQRARKAQWEREQRRINPDFQQGRKISQKKWLANNPNYWKDYRQKNPEQTRKNRALQKIRNRCRNNAGPTQKVTVIAKTDARKVPPLLLSGPFWLVPVIAKTDAVKIYFHQIPGTFR